MFASEATMEIALGAVRICGGNGYLTGYDVERYVRDAPLMIVGEGTSEILRNVVGAQLIARGGPAADPCSVGEVDDGFGAAVPVSGQMVARPGQPVKKARSYATFR